jgi:hypothetical protein
MGPKAHCYAEIILYTNDESGAFCGKRYKNFKDNNRILRETANIGHVLLQHGDYYNFGYSDVSEGAPFSTFIESDKKKYPIYFSDSEPNKSNTLLLANNENA